MTTIKKNPTFSIAFFFSLCVCSLSAGRSVFSRWIFSHCPNRSNAKNIAREWGKRRTHIQMSRHIPPYAPSSPNNTPAHVHGDVTQVTRETNGQTDVGRWWTAGLRRPSGGGTSEVKVDVGFLGNSARTWHGW